MNVKRVAGRLVPLKLAFVAVSLLQPPVACADNLVWRVKNSYRHKVQIAFYSQSRSVEWPGNDQGWDLNDAGTHTYNLTCVTGERICFGAWATGDPSVYWGIGARHEHGCDRCCYVCGAGETARQILD
jgi:hypothetical protein